MQDASSAEHDSTRSAHDASAERAKAAFDLTTRRRLAMVLCGYIPFLHAAAVLALVVLPATGLLPAINAALAPVVLFLVPPLVVRGTLRLRPTGAGRFALASPAFLTWWFCAQWQVVFNRLPFLEECLRLVPALYSAWLRLWGAKVGALVYWSPGVGISDRQLVEVGRRVVLGMGARLHAHVIARGEAEGAPTELLLAPVRIGDDALVGGMSFLAPGVRVAPGEMTPGVYALPPFSEWRAGRRVRHRPEALS